MDGVGVVYGIVWDWVGWGGLLSTGSGVGAGGFCGWS